VLCLFALVCVVCVACVVCGTFVCVHGVWYVVCCVVCLSFGERVELRLDELEPVEETDGIALREI